MTGNPDYNDHTLNAGGPYAVRANPSNLQYGVCGDPSSQPVPRAHESGGQWGKFPTLGAGAVAACYAPGSTIPIQVQLTANHKGQFEFQLCVLEEGENETEDCFRRGPKLEQANGNGPIYPVPDTSNRIYSMDYVLPEGVSCKGNTRCVLRWYYLTGNSPGSQYQEEFWNCADIFIGTTCGVGASVGAGMGTGVGARNVGAVVDPRKTETQGNAGVGAGLGSGVATDLGRHADGGTGSSVGTANKKQIILPTPETSYNIGSNTSMPGQWQKFFVVAWFLYFWTSI